MLGTPWMLLHPCRTAATMQLILDAGDSTALPVAIASSFGSTLGGQADIGLSAQHYVLAWLSFVGPAVGITVHCSLEPSLRRGSCP